MQVYYTENHVLNHNINIKWDKNITLNILCGY